MINKELQQRRLSWLMGEEAVQRISEKTVLLFGCGGVGSFAMEALVRSGIGRLIIVDGDSVAPTNMNRQLIATYDVIGERKVDAARKHCLQCGAFTDIVTVDCMYTLEAYPNLIEDLHEKYHIDYCIDAVDLVQAKLDIISEAKRLGIPVIASMGMGNKLDPTKIEITDISKTSVCPLARVVRRELKKRRITKVPVAYSTELPRETPEQGSPGSCAFVPSSAGLAIAGYVLCELGNISH